MVVHHWAFVLMCADLRASVASMHQCKASAPFSTTDSAPHIYINTQSVSTTASAPHIYINTQSVSGHEHKATYSAVIA